MDVCAGSRGACMAVGPALECALICQHELDSVLLRFPARNHALLLLQTTVDDTSAGLRQDAVTQRMVKVRPACRLAEPCILLTHFLTRSKPGFLSSCAP